MISYKAARGADKVKAVPENTQDGPVAVIGDFNTWDPEATPQAGQPARGHADDGFRKALRPPVPRRERQVVQRRRRRADESNDFGGENAVLDLSGLAEGPVDWVAAAMRRSEIQVQHLHSALGESRRRRAAPDGDDRSAEPDVAGSTTLANDGSADSTVARSGFPRVTVCDRHGARAGLSVVGDLDASAALAFSALVQTLVDEGARSIVVELGAAGVVDADGLQALVGAFEQLEQCRGEMVLRSPRSRTLLAVNPAGLSDVRFIC